MFGLPKRQFFTSKARVNFEVYGHAGKITPELRLRKKAHFSTSFFFWKSICIQTFLKCAFLIFFSFFKFRNFLLEFDFESTGHCASENRGMPDGEYFCLRCPPRPVCTQMYLHKII